MSELSLSLKPAYLKILHTSSPLNPLAEEYLFAFEKALETDERSKLKKSVFLKTGSKFLMFDFTSPNLVASKP